MAKKNKSKKQKNKSKGKINFKFIILLLAFLIFAILYLPTAILFFVGMMPTIAAYFTDKIPGRNKTFTIGTMNFAGCFYYMVSIWSHAKPLEMSAEYLSNPMTIVVIYTAAAFGYGINYLTTIIVASVLRQKSQLRLEKLEDRKKKLIERWGEKVNGDRLLDKNGFPLDTSNAAVEDL